MKKLIRMIKENELYEYDVHHEHFYGTSKKVLNDKIKDGNIIVKDIDVNGTENLVKLLKEDMKIVTIFLRVPYDYIVKNNEEYKNNVEYLKDTEDAYIELSELYNWDRIECVVNNQFRDKDLINEEIYNLVIKMENY